MAIHFLPHMNCPREEAEELTKLWFADMNSKEFRDVAMVCGGKVVNQRLLKVLRMATRLGHLDILKH